jgi:hypothetical protein
VTPATTARHVKGFIQFTLLPGRNDLLKVTGHKTDDGDPAGGNGFLHGPGNGPANQRPDAQAKQVFGPVQRFAANQDMLFPLAGPLRQHKNPPADVKDRRNAILPVVQSDARH